MKYAFNDNGVLRDVVMANPRMIFDAGYASMFIQVPDEAQAGWLYDGTTLSAPPAPALTVADFDAALTAHLDATAQARQYDNRITCMVRAGFPGPFQAEGIAFATWCDTCNALAYTLLANVQAGTRPLPATTQALIDTLPPMVWPD